MLEQNFIPKVFYVFSLDKSGGLQPHKQEELIVIFMENVLFFTTIQATPTGFTARDEREGGSRVKKVEQ